jgi:signal transduction histidine kinase
MLEEVESQAGRMLSIIEDMLCFSIAEHIELNSTPVNTKEIVRKVLLDNRFEIEKKKVLVSVSDLPKLKIPETLQYELISNLLLNAVRYGCEDGGRVEVLGETNSKYRSLIVLDHGPGIPEQERTSVFELFVRGSTSGDTIGTGIGLATVNKIAHRFKGEVQLEETAGGGCTVTLQFPAE